MKIVGNFSFTPHDSSLYNKTGCQNLSKALDMFEKTHLTSTFGAQSNDKFTSFTTLSN